MSNGLPASFWKVPVPFMSALTERISLLKNMVKNNACVQFGRVERQVNDLMVNGQGKLGFSAAWRLSEGRRVER